MLSLYAFDIETDTSAPFVDPEVPSGLDPRAAAITSIAVLGQEGAVSFDDRNEKRLLGSFLSWLDLTRAEPDPVLVTWNGACFDFPFLFDRLKRHDLEVPGVLVPAGSERTPKYQALPGHAGGYFVDLPGFDHVDVAFSWKTWAEQHDVHFGLKPVARAHGVEVIEVDRTRMESLTLAERMAYNLSDVNATLVLAELLGDSLSDWLDSRAIQASR